MNDQKISWEALEYEHRERTPDWYWVLGLISLVLVISAVVYKNFLFAVLVVVGAFTMALYASRKPRLIKFEIGPKGVTIKNTTYLYGHLHSFCPRENARGKKIIFQSQKAVMPHFSVPVPESVNFEEVKSFLAKHLPEEDHPESFSEAVMDRLGF